MQSWFHCACGVIFQFDCVSSPGWLTIYKLQIYTLTQQDSRRSPLPFVLQVVPRVIHCSFGLQTWREISEILSLCVWQCRGSVWQQLSWDAPVMIRPLQGLKQALVGVLNSGKGRNHTWDIVRIPWKQRSRCTWGRSKLGLLDVYDDSQVVSE